MWKRKIGIDKTMLKKLGVKSIDMPKLKSNSNVAINTNGYKRKVIDSSTGEEIWINKIEVKDNHIFQNLTIAIGDKKCGYLPYEKLDLSIRGINGENFNNLNIENYRVMLTKVEGYILERYGIELDLKNATFEEIEINATIPLDKPFEEYRRMLDTMWYLLKGRYKTKNKIDGETYTLANTVVELKIYNKSKQLDEVYNYDTNGEYMRIEYKLLNSNKVRGELKANGVNEVTNEKIKEYFLKVAKKDLITPMEKYLEESNKEMLNIAKELQKTKQKLWTKEFEKECVRYRFDKNAFVFDIEQMYGVIKKVSKTNYNRCIKSLGSPKKEFIGNIERFEEIKNKLGLNKDKNKPKNKVGIS